MKLNGYWFLKDIHACGSAYWSDVNRAVRDVSTHNQGVQEEVYSNFSAAMGIDVLVIVETWEERVRKVGLSPNNACKLDEPSTQIGLPALVVGTTKKMLRRSQCTGAQRLQNMRVHHS